MVPILHSGAQCQHLPSWALVSSANGIDAQHACYKVAACGRLLFGPGVGHVMLEAGHRCFVNLHTVCVRKMPHMLSGPQQCWLALWCDSLMYTHGVH